MIEQLRYLNENKLLINIATKNYFLIRLKRILTGSGRKSPAVVCYLYLGSLYFLFHNNSYFRTLRFAEIIYLDGFILGWVIKILFNQKKERFGAEDYLDQLLLFCQKHQLKVFLFGSTEAGNKKAIKNLGKRFEKLQIYGINGYKKNNTTIIEEINNKKTDFLIIGLGLGRQEEWIEENKANLKNVRVILAVGNIIDILGEQKKLAPEILKRYYLRWVYRLAKEPRRLLKRYVLGLAYIFLVGAYISVKRGIWILKKSPQGG